VPWKRLGSRAQSATIGLCGDGPLEQPGKMRAPRIGPALAAVLLLALAAVYAVPRAIDAFYGLDDPSRVASRALDDTFDAAVAGREIEAALAANDADLAQSFADLAATRNVTIDPVLQEKVTSATAEAATTRRASPADLSLANPMTWLRSREPLSAISSCSAISAMRCAKENGSLPASRPTNWYSASLPPASRSLPALI
jgi:hypothetical protein